MEQNRNNIVYDIDNDITKKNRSHTALIAGRNGSDVDNISQFTEKSNSIHHLM